MDTPQQITARVTRVFDENMARDKRHSFHSWEHCYKFFSTSPADLDLASLHLAFYLASWGMYRGSAAIRNYDYLIHRPVAEEVLKPEYAPLRAASIEALSSDLDHLLWPLIEKIKVSGMYPKAVNVSDTLVTKILMGTLGCTPAYDRFFKSGLEEKGLRSYFSYKNFRSLVRCCQTNRQAFADAQSHIQKTADYPVMRVIDMYFHSIGSENPWIDENG